MSLLGVNKLGNNDCNCDIKYLWKEKHFKARVLITIFISQAKR